MKKRLRLIFKYLSDFCSRNALGKTPRRNITQNFYLWFKWMHVIAGDYKWFAEVIYSAENQPTKLKLFISEFVLYCLRFIELRGSTFAETFTCYQWNPYFSRVCFSDYVGVDLFVPLYARLFPFTYCTHLSTAKYGLFPSSLESLFRCTINLKCRRSQDSRHPVVGVEMCSLYNTLGIWQSLLANVVSDLIY